MLTLVGEVMAVCARAFASCLPYTPRSLDYLTLVFAAACPISLKALHPTAMVVHWYLLSVWGQGAECGVLDLVVVGVHLWVAGVGRRRVASEVCGHQSVTSIELSHDE